VSNWKRGGLLLLEGSKRGGQKVKGRGQWLGAFVTTRGKKRKKMVDGVCEILKVLIIVVRLWLPTLIHKRIGEIITRE
jgi:hypothetical protein